VSTRVTAAAQFVVEDGISVSCAARVHQVSRQSVYDRLRPAPSSDSDAADEDVRAAGRRSRRALHLVAPVLPEDWQMMDLGPERCDVEVAIHVLARRHPAAGYRKIAPPPKHEPKRYNTRQQPDRQARQGSLRKGHYPEHERAT
jgi:hypothetical protein